MMFYVLRNPREIGANSLAVTDYVPLGPVQHGDAPACEVCGSYLGSMPWLAPRLAELELWTGPYGDIAFGPYLELLVSEAFALAFCEAGLTGVESFDKVEIVRIKGRGVAKPEEGPPRYLCARPVFSQTKIALEASEVETKEPVVCDACRSGLILRYARVVVEEDTWPGEDIFFARGLPGVIITSERFAKWFTENEINTGVLVPALEHSEDFSPAQ